MCKSCGGKRKRGGSYIRGYAGGYAGRRGGSYIRGYAGRRGVLGYGRRKIRGYPNYRDLA